MLIPSSPARSVVFILESYPGPPFAGCPRMWPTGSNILAHGYASAKKIVSKRVGGGARLRLGKEDSIETGRWG